MSNLLPLTWSKKKNSPQLEAYFKQFGSDFYFTAEEINALRDSMNELFSVFQGATDFKGAIDLTSPVPTVPGYFIPTVSGTYSKFGGLVIDLTLGMTTVSFDGTAYKKQVVPIDLTLYAKKSDTVDNLTSTSVTTSLSANQGRFLKVMQDFKLDKRDSPIKKITEEGAFLTDEKGKVFFSYEDGIGVDFPKISDSLYQKFLTLLNLAQGVGNSTTNPISQAAFTSILEEKANVLEVLEEGAFFCNEEGEVFASFKNGVFTALGLEVPVNIPTISAIEDIANVLSATTGQYLKKNADGNWEGANVVIPAQFINSLLDVNVNPSEGNILKYQSGKWVNATVDLNGLITTDSRASHALFGKNYFVFGDSHKATPFNFYSGIAAQTGSNYYDLSSKTVSVGGINEVHYFIKKLSTIDYVTYINEVDTGISPNCDGFNTSQMADIALKYCQSEGISLDYIIVANVHYAEWNFYNSDGSIIEYIPKVFLNPTRTFSRLFSTASLASSFFNSINGLTEIVDELGFTTTDSTVKVRYGTSGQTLSFSFSSGTTLNENTVATISFGSNKISTNLTVGMTLEDCVDAINQWAFQEFSTWVNANKGIYGGNSIILTYSATVGGNASSVGVLSSNPTSNLQMNTPVISSTNTAFILQYCSNDVTGLRVLSNWLTAGGNVNWNRPHTSIGAMAHIGKNSPYTKWIFLGLWNTQMLNTYVYPNSTINPYSLLNSSSYKAGQSSKKSLKNMAEFFGGQYIDVDKLCGINVFNVVPTFNNYNDVHMKLQGYAQSVDCIVRNIK